MENKDFSQLELFSPTLKTSGKTTMQSNNDSFFKYIRGYEKIIFILIILVITGIVSFSLGIEKGKKLVSAKPEEEKPAGNDQAVTPLPLKETLQNYTIQVATYKYKTSAEREAEALEREGFSPLVISTGKHIVLCVGKFSDKETAQQLQSKLKKRYQDCFIRRL